MKMKRILCALLTICLICGLLPVTAMAEDVDKTALSELLETVADDTTEYYTSGDRYNGKTTSENGFFRAFGLSGARGRARKVLNNASATQAEVDAAVQTLQAAIDAAGLIPTTQINATELYEAVQLIDQYCWRYDNTVSTSGGEAVTGENTTARSYAAFTVATNDAENVLSMLFNEDGNATEYNDVSGEAVNDVAAVLEALAAAVDALDKKADEDGIADATVGYAALSNLLAKIFNPVRMNAEAYTADSWASFLTAHERAQSYINTHAEPVEDIGVREAAGWVNEAYAFWRAGFEGLKDSGETVHVTLSVNDNFAVTAGQAPSDYCGTYEVTLPTASATLGSVLAAALGNGYSLTGPADAHFAVGLYLNGVYVSGESYSYSQQILNSKNYTNVRVKDGDQITLAFMYAPVWTSMIGVGTTAPTSEVVSDIQYYRTDTALVEAEAGEDFSLTVRYNLALPAGYNGAILPKEGVRVFISDVCATEAEVREAAAVHELGTTDLTGQITLNRFSVPGAEEGWYVVSFFGSGSRGGLGNGMNVLIHVTDPSDLSGAKSLLSEKLRTLYEKYPESYYTADQLSTVQAAYSAGMEGITAAPTTGDANRAYEEAVAIILPIQQENDGSLTLYLNTIQAILGYLPSERDLDAGKLYNSDKELLDLLFGEDGVYDKLSVYQTEQLSYGQYTVLAKLKAAYEASSHGEDLPDAPAVSVTINAVDIETGEEIEGIVTTGPTSVSYQNLCGFYFHPTEYIYYTESESEWTSLDSGLTNFQVPGGGYYQTSLSSLQIDSDEYMFAGGTTWASQVSYNVEEHYHVINGRRFRGLRDDLIYTAYVEKKTVQETDSFAEQLTVEFEKLSKTNYTSENWRSIVEIYNAGLAAIKAAETDEDKQNALDNAVTEMNAVEQKDFATYGNGTVIVSFSNTTTPRNLKTGQEYQATLYNPDEPIFTCEMQLFAEDTMMTVLLRALSSEEYNELTAYTWLGTGGGSPDGYDISYLSTVSDGMDSLAEFDGGDGSGWMGKLNDFFVNNGLDQYTVADGTLSDGDVIEIVYTTNLGLDVGGAWGDPDTTLKSLTIEGGELLPPFEIQTPRAGDTAEYAVLIDGASAALTITPDAKNKNYLTKIFLNEKVTSNIEGNSYYKRTQPVPVAAGDTVYIGVGEHAWPSMNNQGDEASIYSGTWYVLHVINEEGVTDYINGLISALPSVSYDNYKDVAQRVNVIDQSISDVTEGINEATLNEARARCEMFAEFDELRADLKTITVDSSMDRTGASDLLNRYDGLLQQEPSLIYNLTKAEVNKIDAIRAALNGGETPPEPEEPSAQVVSASLTLTGEIGINYYVIPDETLAADPDAYAVFTFKGAEGDAIPLNSVPTDVKNGVTRYIFTKYVAAKEMTELSTLRLYSGAGVQATLTNASGGTLENNAAQYSVAHYCGSVTSPEGQALAEKLGNFGARSMTYFGYTAQEPDTAYMSAVSPVAVDASAADLIGFVPTKTGSIPGLTVKGISLTLESMTTINLSFSVTGGHTIEEYTFTLNGQSAEIHSRGGLYYLHIRNIAAKELDTACIVTVTDGSSVMTVNCCGLSYAYNTLKNYSSIADKAALCELARSVYAYNQAANDYFDS